MKKSFLYLIAHLIFFALSFYLIMKFTHIGIFILYFLFIVPPINLLYIFYFNKHIMYKSLKVKILFNILLLIYIILSLNIAVFGVSLISDYTYSFSLAENFLFSNTIIFSILGLLFYNNKVQEKIQKLISKHIIIKIFFCVLLLSVLIGVSIFTSLILIKYFS